MNGNHKRMHMLKASMLKRPKDEGGLNIRDLRKFNKALIAKHVWNIVDKPNSLYSKWFLSKYRRPYSKFSFKKTSQDSMCWKVINGSRDLISTGLKWVVGNGSSIKLSSEYWSFRLNGNHIGNNLKLADKMKNQPHVEWDWQKLGTYFSRKQIRKIMDMPISRFQKEDVMAWSHSTNGRYSVKEGYKKLLSANSVNGGQLGNFPWNWFWKLDMPKRNKKIKEGLEPSPISCLHKIKHQLMDYIAGSKVGEVIEDILASMVLMDVGIKWLLSRLYEMPQAEHPKVTELVTLLGKLQIESAYQLIVNEYRQELERHSRKESKLKDLEAKIIAIKQVYVDTHIEYCQELRSAMDPFIINDEERDLFKGIKMSEASTSELVVEDTPERELREHSLHMSRSSGAKMVSEPVVRSSNRECFEQPYCDREVEDLLEDLELESDRLNYASWCENLSKEDKINLEISDSD
ncbi:ribonuclease H [Senna tora]|uniref:Ribonuclease H n=1 Tax=Senna tora TaxID=362788 RepID=A0A834TSP7_9FABA|nr:ribonuclease H [Senna tora]